MHYIAGTAYCDHQMSVFLSNNLFCSAKPGLADCKHIFSLVTTVKCSLKERGCEGNCSSSYSRFFCIGVISRYFCHAANFAVVYILNTGHDHDCICQIPYVFTKCKTTERTLYNSISMHHQNELWSQRYKGLKPCFVKIYNSFRLQDIFVCHCTLCLCVHCKGLLKPVK